MITNEVIKEIYKKFPKPHKDDAELNLDYYVDMLSEHHNIRIAGGEFIIEDLDEYNPFRCFLIRSVNTILDFDKFVAVVFSNHILFLGKKDNALRIHIKPEKPKSLFARIFGRKG